MAKKLMKEDEFCDLIMDRVTGYSTSGTTQGDLDAVNSIVIDLAYLMYRKGLLTESDLRLLCEKWPNLDGYKK